MGTRISSCTPTAPRPRTSTPRSWSRWFSQSYEREGATERQLRDKGEGQRATASELPTETERSPGRLLAFVEPVRVRSDHRRVELQVRGTALAPQSLAASRSALPMPRER